MNDRTPFLKALAENEDDTPTRLVYADWLDDRGEHEEADRQRQWPAAKEWLAQFCRDHNPPLDDEDQDQWRVTCKELIDLGRTAIEEADQDGVGFSCGDNMDMCDALRQNSGKFWKNWAIVTGIALPPDIEATSQFRCAC